MPPASALPPALSPEKQTFQSHSLPEKLPLPSAPTPTPERPTPLSRHFLRTSPTPGPPPGPGPGPGGLAPPARPLPEAAPPPSDNGARLPAAGLSSRPITLISPRPRPPTPSPALLAPFQPSRASPPTQPTGALLHSLFGIHAGHVTAAAAAATAALAAAAADLTLRAAPGSRRGMR